MPAERIYTSHLPSPELPETSVFSYLFPSPGQPSYVPAAARNPELPMYIDGLTGRTLKRGQLEDDALRIASGLKALGLRRGDTALLVGPNALEWVVAAYALQAAGITASPSNVAYGPRELAHQYNDSGASAVLVHPALLPVLSAAKAEFKSALDPARVLLLSRTEDKPQGAPFKSIYEVKGARATPEAFDGPAARETAWLCYSSGTTGLPKGVQTSHYNLTSQLQAVNLVYPTLTPGQDSILGVLPFSHIFGLATLVTQPLTSGVPVVVFPKFDELAVLAGIQRYRVTYGCVVPPIILLLLHSQNTRDYDLTSLRTLQCGAAPLSPELASAFEGKFPHCRVSQGYGLTETTPTITYAIAADVGARKGSCGRLIPTYEARLVQEDGTDAPEGGRGELWVRGPSVMTRGYHRNADATRKTMSGDWFMTGDVAVRDADGWYTIVDRVKELIKYKGFQVPPAELEALLLTHPKLIDAGVVGVWVDTQATELPRAYVVPAPGAVDLTDAAARAKFGVEVGKWVAERVAQHKKLRGGVVVVPAIPKSPSGKILRKDLRKVAEAEMKAEAVKAKL